MAAVGEITITRESFLGRGGFGEVYRGIWTQNGDQVPAAIKSIQHTNSEEEFQREIDLLRQMDHLFVVKFLGSTVVDSVKYIGLELCEGTLNQYIHGKLEKMPKGTFEEKYLAGQITFALSYLHSKRIIHKDLKPDNVLLWQSSTGLTLAKLADFGFSRQLPLDRTTFDDTTHLGTSGYIAPELCRAEEGERVPSFASDIWSLGIVLFFIVSDGQHPYGERLPKRDFDIRNHLIKEMKVPPNVRDVETEKWDAADLILHMIDTDPENRPNITDVLIHPYFSLTTEATRKQFLAIVHDIFRDGGHSHLSQFYSQPAIQHWYDTLDPQVKRKDIEEDLKKIKPILTKLDKARNELAEPMRKISNLHEDSQIGQQRKQVIDSEKHIISKLEGLTTYNPRIEVLRKLLDAGPRLVTTYTWSQLQSKKWNSKDHTELQMDDVCLSMFFLTPEIFEELIEVKMQRLEQQNSQTQLDNWFHFACFFDLPEMALILHCAGADVNSKKPGGWTALHLAVLNKRSLQLVTNLLEIEADPLAASDDGTTALHVAALSNDNPDVVQQILNYSLDRDPNCRCLPTKLSGITVRDLAVLNPNPLIQDLFSFSEGLVGPLPGMFVLSLAAMTGDVRRINYVIDKGGNVNFVDEIGQTPLHHICVFTGLIEVVKALLKAGADPNIQDNQGMTALHLAVIGSNVEYAEYLLNNEYIKANPNLQANNQRTCLHYVPIGVSIKLEDCFSIVEQPTFRNVITSLARQNCLNVQAIEEHVCEPFLREAQNTIPPAWTNGENHCQMIETLWAAGANLHSRDNEGNTPLHCIAANSPNVETTKLLLALGADPLARNHEGYLPLHCAAQQNPSPEVTQVLWFATFNSKDFLDDMQTTAELATENENCEVLDLIICLMGQ